jgi:V/A-type H+-transporting ATPase subunit K
MMNQVIAGGLTALLALALAGVWVARRSGDARTTLRTLVGGAMGINGLILVACLAMVLVLASPTGVLAQSPGTATTAVAAADTGKPLGAALATGLACIGAGIAVGIAGAAAIGGITEKPELLGRTLIFVGLAEGIAIYGLIISFMILNG